jgi:hypothetical protein
VIVYDLSCENQHRFEGWFASSEDFKQQQNERRISCPLCGNDRIMRLPHAPRLNLNNGDSDASAEAKPDVPKQYANLGSEILAKLIDHIIETTEDVGPAFPEEARRIHYRETQERRIRGTAAPDEVTALREEGIEVAALPIPPHRLGKPH